MIYLVLGIISDLQKTHQTLWNWLKHHLERTTKLFTIVFLYIFLKYIRSSIHLVMSIESSNNVNFYCKVKLFLFGRTFLHDFLEIGWIDYHSEKLWIELPAHVIVFSFFYLIHFIKTLIRNENSRISMKHDIQKILNIFRIVVIINCQWTCTSHKVLYNVFMHDQNIAYNQINIVSIYIFIQNRFDIHLWMCFNFFFQNRIFN